MRWYDVMMSVGYHFNLYFDHNSEHNKVIHKVLRIGHENSQFWQNKESNNNMWGKCQHNEKTGSEAAFCSKTYWKRGLALNCIVIEPKYPNGLLLLSLTMKCILSSLPNGTPQFATVLPKIWCSLYFFHAHFGWLHGNLWLGMKCETKVQMSTQT